MTENRIRTNEAEHGLSDKADRTSGRAGSTVINLRSLDALRGLLAIFVLAHHARWLLWSGYENWSRSPHPFWQNFLAYAAAPLRFGHEAVMVFFVLSGFFIHWRAAERMAAGKAAELDASVFFRRRAHRLVPPYLLALGVTVVLDAVGRLIYPQLYNAQTGDGLLDANFTLMDYSPLSVVPAAFMLPDSFGRQFGSNGPLWSLAFEVVYYLLYPAWLGLRRRGWFTGYVVGGLGAMAVALPFTGRGFLPLVLLHYPIWLAGAALAELLPRITPAFSLRWFVLPATIVGALGVTTLRLPSPVLIAVYVAGGTATVLWCAWLPAAFTRTPLHLAWEKVGLGSYTVYVVHFPVLTLLCAIAMQHYGSRPTSGWPALIGACVTALFCGLCYRVCERHFLHHKVQAPPVSL